MFDKFFSLLWQLFHIFGQLFNVVSGLILKIKLAIWSQRSQPSLAHTNSLSRGSYVKGET